jgi:class 3 adenylate cyclase/tetratricopeptide (TPR) repeat protein
VSEPRRERKVVTVLFADLVGFTSRAEELDPEDVEEILRPYHQRLRRELERHGGTVEKFIGDAVMAVFGAPIAHEDDPERGVRAALAIRDWAREEDNLEVRIAVNTGEALVRLGAKPAEGEGMVAGDVVNTAARLQAAAPVNGVLVGETTYRATREAIEYAEAEPVSAKGKAEPVDVWEASQPRSRIGLEAAAPATPLVGRKRERELLLGALARARAEEAAQLVTIVGVPGIGKSRLVYELSQAVENEPDLISWRRGRSLPYGEGVTYWALGEMVKAQAGILETDTADATERKLRAAVAELADDPTEAQWLETSLRPLVGLVEESPSPRDERFAAWRRAFESLAERRPLVLVFEDLHWADDDLLDLVDWAGRVPLLVVCTARPELLERRPAWGGGKQNALTISLSPLSDDDTARLIASLLERAVLASETQTELLTRAGGNPLFAEQFARMLGERDAGEPLTVPETVHGMIAARLDLLTPEEKALLQDAAVVGSVFWAGSLGVIGARTGPVEEPLHRLERKEFIRRQRQPSVEGELEYAFHHVLLRDVAYAQIPRAARAGKHRAAAEWIESLGRPDDHAEMLAHHYLAALEYARAAGGETEQLEARARVALREAGDRALALNAFHSALRFYRGALELWPADDADRPQLLLRAGKAQWLAEEAEADVNVLAEASELLVGAGEAGDAAEAEIMIADVLWHGADHGRVLAHLRRAMELVAALPTSRSKAYVLAHVGRFHMLAGEMEDAIRVGNEALQMAQQLGLDDLLASALNSNGVARVVLGDREGLTDLERSIAVAEESGSPWETGRAYINLASILWELGEVERSAAYHDEGLELAQRFGLATGIRWLNAEKAVDNYVLGAWDEAFGAAETVIELAAKGSPHYMEAPCREVRGLIRLGRGDKEGALEDTAAALELARSAGDPQALWPALAYRAHIAAELGLEREAAELADELLELWRGPLESIPSAWAFGLAVVLDELGRSPDLLEAAAQARASSRWLDGATAYAAGDFAAAAEILGKIPSRADAALADLHAAKVAIGAGRRAEGDVHLHRALAFWRSVGATHFVRQGEALLAESA